MPTLICIDVSLSMEQSFAENTLLSHTVSSLRTFLSNLQNVVPNELIEIITFSHCPTVLIEFTKNTSQLLGSLESIKSEDRTDVPLLIEFCLQESQQWNVITPTHIILITDKIPAPLKEPVTGFPHGSKMSLIGLTPTTDVNNKAHAFVNSCGLTGKHYPGPVLGKDSIDRIFENIMLDNYVKFEASLWFGHQSTRVVISPAPDMQTLSSISQKTSPTTFPSALRIHGFLPATDLHNPPYVSRHLIHPSGPATPAKQASKIPDLRIMLNESLRAKDYVAVIDLGECWFGIISSHLPKSERNLKKSNLIFGIIAPQSFNWLGNPIFLGLKRLVSSDKQSNMPYKEGHSKSYDNKANGGAGMVWIKSSTLKQNVQKVIRYAKRLPDKGSVVFLKELNKVRKSILFYGFTDMMGMLCNLLEREKNDENSEIIERCIMQLKDASDPSRVIK